MKKKAVIWAIAVILILSGATALFIFKPFAKQAQLPPQSVEQSSEETEEAPAVEITDEARQLIGVKTAEVKAVQLEKALRTVGRVEIDERKIYSVNTKFEGWIEKLYADSTGIEVRKGAPLAEIYSPELLSTQEEFISALKWAKSSEGGETVSEDTESLIAGARRRLRLWDIGEEQIRIIEETRTPLKTLTLKSPASGFVMEKMAIKGMRVMPGEKLFVVADISSVWVIADVYEYELGFVRPGQKASITFGYLPGKEFASRLDYIYPAISEETRTAKARFVVQNAGMRLKPGMFAEVRVNIPLGKRLAVPKSAVIDSGERNIAYVDKGDGYFEPREIEAGIEAGGMREVLSGLKAGEKVASSATFLIDSEAQLRGVAPLPKKPASGKGADTGKTPRPAGHTH